MAALPAPAVVLRVCLSVGVCVSVNGSAELSPMIVRKSMRLLTIEFSSISLYIWWGIALVFRPMQRSYKNPVPLELVDSGLKSQSRGGERERERASLACFTVLGHR